MAMKTLSPSTHAELKRITDILEAMDVLALATLAHQPIPDRTQLSQEGLKISLARGVLKRRTGHVVKDVD